MKNNYHNHIKTGMPVHEVFEKINNVAAWWTPDINGRTHKVNDVFTVSFGDTFVTFRIIEMVTDKKVKWYVTDCNLPFQNDKKEWKDTTVDFEVHAQNGDTQIDFTHIGLAPGAECYDLCKEGWDFYITKSLSKFINEGSGLPQTPREAR